MTEETREEREKRRAREYAEYVAQCKSDGVEAINFQNWSYNEKLKEKDVS